MITEERPENPYASLKTLRDEFAMAALAGLIGTDWYDDDRTAMQIGDGIARDSYTLADAMLKVRKEGQS